MFNYSNPQIVLQEVPGEISLAISISGCNLKCKGCHSSHTWDKDYGERLTKISLNNLIKKNKHISCVLFYGGEWNIDYLKELFLHIKIHFEDLKIALYTGREFNFFKEEDISSLDYLKTGPYKASNGPLRDLNTNQKFFQNKEGFFQEIEFI